jgi:transposase InsO family protein
MPWKECDRMSQKREFVQFCDSECRNVALLCRRFGISRKTGYKWLRRYSREGLQGLEEHSRRPLHSSLQTSKDMEKLILDVRRKHTWGGRKIHAYLCSKGVCSIPAPSTITGILRRNGCISDQASANAQQWHRFERESPNELWQMDFKGYFPTQRERCNPLTVLDDHSRFCLCLHACGDQRGETVRERLISIFRCYGLPWQINTDNGPPWGAERQGEYTRLSLWLIRLGIVVSFSAPSHPQTNGKDERFHRTLKAEVLQGRDFRHNREVQQSFDYWRTVYNFERPHDALENAVPASRYQVSNRKYPEVMPEIIYGPDDAIRRVDCSRKLCFQGQKIRVSKVLCGEHVAIRPTVEDGVFDVYWFRQKMRTIDLRQIPNKD